MAKSENQKLKILYLMKIFLQETDEDHSLTISDIIAKLAKYNISVERKTVYGDIETLRQFGLDIKMQKSKTFDYLLASRDFELPELKLLVDAVQSSKFITAKKSNELIRKIEGLTSRYEAGKLQRQVFVANRVKTMNESIYYNIDSIHQAIAEGKKLSFKYFDYTINKEKQTRRNGELYIASPISLAWDDENYYLIAFSERHKGLVHYRVDKMNSILITDEIRVIPDVEKFDLADYTKKVFGMFGGQEETVRLQFVNSLVGVVIDRFGKDIAIIKEDEEHFVVTIHVAISPVFLAWLFQFGNSVKVLSPISLIDDIKQRAKLILDNYEYFE